MNIYLVAGIYALLFLLCAWLLVRSPINPKLIANFAQRRGFGLTPHNADHVLGTAYVTRTWRIMGLVVGLCLMPRWVGKEDPYSTSLLPRLDMPFWGWLLGVCIAEWVLAGPRSGQRRVANLSPRTLSNYLSRGSLRMLWITGAVILASVGVGLGAMVFRPTVRGDILISLALVLLVSAVVWLRCRRILRRQQATAHEDIRVIDDAMRTKSLRTVLGAGFALNALSVFIVLDASFSFTEKLEKIGENNSDNAAVLIAITVLGWIPLLLVIIGWRFASSSVHLPRPQPAQPVESA